jgi:hypothetical protein
LTRACDGFGHLVAAIRTVRAGAEVGGGGVAAEGMRWAT